MVPRQPAPAGRVEVREALERLGVDRFVLGIHEAALPSAPGPETGHGSLAARGGQAFLAFAHDLGFDGLQLGPAGMTGRGNPSPYDSTLFSRSLLAVDLVGLADDPRWPGLLPRGELDAILERVPPGAAERVPYEWSWDTAQHVSTLAWRELERQRVRPVGAALSRRVDDFAEANRQWLEGDALYQALAHRYGDEDWRRWPDARHRELWAPSPGGEHAADDLRRRLQAELAGPVGRWALAQAVLADQHAAARRRAEALGLMLYGDLQVGMSPGDEWRWRRLFLSGYRLGAPPSRTNPEGQSWGYPVLDPTLLYADSSPPSEWPTDDPAAAPGPVGRFLDLRFAKAFAEYDALRLDHPHGLVCPWVYRDDAGDALEAVQSGARLFGSPAETDHPRLAAWAIAHPDQVDQGVVRWDDDRIRALDASQVARHAALLDRAVAAASHAGHGPADLACEVLSTMPYPLSRVLERYGLGRFRVTQKAAFDDPADVSRADTARPQDWVMLGTHDTPPIWRVLRRWEVSGELAARAERVAATLAVEPAAREHLARRFRQRPGELATGMLAELLACPARSVFVFFTDLLGIDTEYNRPGVTDPANWTLRVPPGALAGHRERCRAATALDVPRACALALAARGERPGSNDGLVERLGGVE